MMMLEDEVTSWAKGFLGLKDKDMVEVLPLARGGSGRRYFRLKWNGGSTVLMHYDTERQENAFFYPIGRFLAAIGFPVPHIYAHNEMKKIILLEDLGDETLFSFRAAPERKLLELYHRVIEGISILHAYPVEALPAQEVPLMAGFDTSLYRWEREYFQEYFLRRLQGVRLSVDEEKALEEELADLALRLASFPPCLVHRDLQSQNVMIRAGKPYFIDFQGLRKGNPFYDIGSLVYDPYMPLGPEKRLEIAMYYYELRGFPFGRDEYLCFLWEASAQRLLQALGAFAFLGSVKGSRDFLSYVGPGIENLIYVTALVPGLTRLHELALRLDRERREGYSDRQNQGGKR